MKRTVTQQINISQFGTSPSENTKELSPHQDCSLVHILSDESPCSLQNAKEGVSKSFEEGHVPADVDYKSTKSMPNSEKKRKLKANQPSQLSLKSFFQKVSSATNGMRSCSKEAMQSPEDTSKLSDKLKDTPRSSDVIDGFDESDFGTSTPAMEQNLSAASRVSEKDKKDSALMEWRRIQQFMQDSIPLCNGHNEPCVSRVVKKQGPNFGHRFYCCARSEVIAFHLLVQYNYFGMLYQL